MTTVSTKTLPFSTAHIEDLKVAASKRQGANRRSFQAKIALKYCRGSTRQTETLFGWSRHTVKLGLHERRTGGIYLGV